MLRGKKNRAALRSIHGTPFSDVGANRQATRLAVITHSAPARGRSDRKLTTLSDAVPTTSIDS
jgi:hypothetical protein